MSSQYLDDARFLQDVQAKVKVFRHHLEKYGRHAALDIVWEPLNDETIEVRYEMAVYAAAFAIYWNNRPIFSKD